VFKRTKDGRAEEGREREREGGRKGGKGHLRTWRDHLVDHPVLHTLFGGQIKVTAKILLDLLRLSASETRKLSEEKFVLPHGAFDFQDDITGLAVDLLLMGGREGGRDGGKEGG